MTDKTKIHLCCWWEDGTDRAAGWYWDSAEGSGGFDRISPEGPYESKAEVQASAESTWAIGLHDSTIVWFDGKPDHY